MTKAAKADTMAVNPPRIAEAVAGEVVARSCDISIVVGADGIIRSLTVHPDNTDLGSLDHWVKRKLSDFLTVESRTKFLDRLEKLAVGDMGILRRIELNHSDNTTWEFPIRYTIHETGYPDEWLMTGQDLRPVAQIQQQLVKAQLALEQDYENYREIESRYRLLLDTVQEAVVIVDCTTGRIAELNEAAAQLLGASVEALSGSVLAQSFLDQQRVDFGEAIRQAGITGNPKPLHFETRREATTLTLHARLFRTGGDVLAMCRLNSADDQEGDRETLGRLLTALFYNAPDAFVFTDTRGTILEANEAFLILASAAQQQDVQGRSLADFMARGGVDLKVLTENAQRVGRMRNYGTKAVSTIGSQFSVDVSVTSLRDAREPGFGFIIRDMSPVGPVAEPGVGNQALQSVVELVGSAPLRELVSATTDVVEKMCIEAAVELTNNNRVAAAEMLGLSRQSLYVKLRKYGLISQGIGDA
ncbi:MAG: transcriptional regulator PpsR [Pseudomonadota bacterium]